MSSSTASLMSEFHQLRGAFLDADSDGGGDLDLDEFTEAFGKILGPSLSKQDIINLFMKIDADSNGTVNWDEFVDYMMLENQSKMTMRDEDDRRYFETSVIPDTCPRNCHTQMISRVIFIEKLGAYMTSSEDGSLKTWSSESLACTNSIKVQPLVQNVFE